MIAYETHFNDLDEWLLVFPWGTPDGMNGYVSTSVTKLVDDGVKLDCSTGLIDVGYMMPRIFWNGAPFSYGLFEAEMTVPKQRAVPDFVLYSQARYKMAVRSILPEIDIAEFGTERDPIEQNIAVHHWANNPAFLKHWNYKDPIKRHGLDYLGHEQRSIQVDWNERRTNYKCEVTKRSVKVYINGQKQFTYCKKLDAFFTPTFGIGVPNWIKNPYPKHMVVHYFKVEQ